MLAANPKLAQWEEQKRLQKRIDGLRGKVQVSLRIPTFGCKLLVCICHIALLAYTVRVFDYPMLFMMLLHLVAALLLPAARRSKA